MKKLSKLIVAISALCLLAPTGVVADKLPTPKVDYNADMKIDGLAQPMKIFKSGDMVRTEISDGTDRIISILNTKKRESILLRNEGGQKIALVSKIDPDQMRALDPSSALANEENLNARRAGSDTVAGVRCDNYKVNGEFGGEPVEGDFCFSSDGVLLRARTNEAGSSQAVTMEAVALKVGPQDPNLFEVPEGYQRLELDLEGIASFMR